MIYHFNFQYWTSEKTIKKTVAVEADSFMEAREKANKLFLKWVKKFYGKKICSSR